MIISLLTFKKRLRVLYELTLKSEVFTKSNSMKASGLLFLFLLIMSCGSPDNEIIEVDFERISDNEITLSAIADDITYVTLDNNYPMSIFYGIELFNDTIYVDEKDNGMFALDMTGKIIRRYGSRGRGPGEYFYGLRFSIDRNDRVIYLLDRKNILKYSLDGTFLGNISLEKYPGHFSDIKFQDSLIIAFDFNAGNAVYNWIVIDAEGNLIKGKFNSVPSFKSGWGFRERAYELESSTYYYNVYNDTVFSISPDLSYRTSFLFKPSELRWPRHQVDLSERFNYILVNLVLETRAFIVIQYYYKKSHMAFIDKSNGKSYKVTWEEENGGIINDLDRGVPFEPIQYLKKEGREYLVGYTQALDIISRVHSDDFKNSTPKSPKKKEALSRLAENLKETDNPLLTLVRLKN
ncbi:MAG: 6-bladed beta-propeller [Bacteroidales bacterium]